MLVAVILDSPAGAMSEEEILAPSPTTDPHDRSFGDPLNEEQAARLRAAWLRWR